MDSPCGHLNSIVDVAPSDPGCHECLQTGGTWVHLRRCVSCGHIGCCDNSPGRHATAHHGSSGHPLIQSFEPGEDWFWCYVDRTGFEVAGRTGSPSHS